MAVDQQPIIYLDACCLNRPFDDQTQDRIRLETEAIVLIIRRLQTQEWLWLGSEVLDFEIEQTPDTERRLRVQLLAEFVYRSIEIGPAEEDRARQLQALGFKLWDALHIACAELGQADVFLTTDDKLLNLARRLTGQLNIQVENPLTWLQEVSKV
ncbi:MAG: hypothetical protein BroJett011_65300 [Chloroflexota bacterium]|nr:MAG: hypothetical protein BroJett011_65300 [Chloroflexota bacterium]